MAALEKEVAPSPWSLSQFLNSCRGERPIWVLEDDAGELAGFAICQLVADEATLMNIAVSPRVQRQGWGRRLLGEVVAGLGASGAERLMLEVRRGNSAAIALYLDQGFSEDGRRKAYYPAPGGREDALLMSRELEQ